MSYTLRIASESEDLSWKPYFTSDWWMWIFINMPSPFFHWRMMDMRWVFMDFRWLKWFYVVESTEWEQIFEVKIKWDKETKLDISNIAFIKDIFDIKIVPINNNIYDICAELLLEKRRHSLDTSTEVISDEPTVLGESIDARYSTYTRRGLETFDLVSTEEYQPSTNRRTPRIRIPTNQQSSRQSLQSEMIPQLLHFNSESSHEEIRRAYDSWRSHQPSFTQRVAQNQQQTNTPSSETSTSSSTTERLV